MPTPLTEADLAQFHGTDHWYRAPFSKTITFTEGVHYVAEKGGAVWLLVEIVLAQTSTPRVAAQEFQVWTLTVHDDRSATLTCEDGDYHRVFSKTIPWTDFPLPQMTWWLTDNVILLPSEY